MKDINRAIAESFYPTEDLWKHYNQSSMLIDVVTECGRFDLATKCAILFILNNPKLRAQIDNLADIFRTKDYSAVERLIGRQWATLLVKPKKKHKRK